MAPRPTEFAEDPRVEEIEDDDSDDDGPPPLAEAGTVSAQDDADEKGSTRGEKKNRKAIVKAGLKQMEGVERVTLKKSKNVMFVVAKPDVFHNPGSNTYVVFGTAKIEDLQARQREENRQSTRQGGGSGGGQRAPQPQPSAAPSRPSAASGSEENVDETGVSSDDIDLVMGQSGCTRAAAVSALKNNDNDIVNAIMELTM